MTTKTFRLSGNDIDRAWHVLDAGGRPLGRVASEAAQRLICTCAPVRDYTGQEVARVGMFGHGPDERPMLSDHNRGAWDLARRISLRLGHLSSPLDVPA